MTLLRITLLSVLLSVCALGKESVASIDLPKEQESKSFSFGFSASNYVGRVLLSEAEKFNLKESTSITRISFFCEKNKKIKRGILLFDPKDRDICVGLVFLPVESGNIPTQSPSSSFLVISNSIMELADQAGKEISNISNICIHWNASLEGQFLSMNSFLDSKECIATKVSIK